MKIKEIKSRGIKVYFEEEGKEIARAFLYIMHNDLHKEPFGLLEDVYVDESLRGQGKGTKMVNKIIELAKENKCYKLIATSRYPREKVHKLYLKLGFEDWGKEFRINL
tara:strand:+ start:1597 stop:1920 length:324 start_codon:yes stop_codon:yes gene_type:complete